MDARRTGSDGDAPGRKVLSELLRCPSFHREGSHTDPIGGVGPLAELIDARQVIEPLPQFVRESSLVSGNCLHAMGCQCVARRRERHRPEEVRRPGLEASRSRGPGDIVERDETHRATSVKERRPVGETCRGGDERSGAERRVDLVPGEGTVDRARGDRRDDGRQLRSVDEDERAVFVRQPGDVRDRRHLTRDARGRR